MTIVGSIRLLTGISAIGLQTEWSIAGPLQPVQSRPEHDIHDWIMTANWHGCPMQIGVPSGRLAEVSLGQFFERGYSGDAARLPFS